MIDKLDSPSLFKVLIDHAPFAIAIFDVQMCYLAASRRWVADYGLEGRDIIGRPHYKVFPDDPKAWRAVHRKALRGTRHQEGEDRFVRKDGTVQWIRWLVEPWQHTDGETGGIIIFTRDITAYKLNEEALRKSEIYFKTLFQNTSDYVLLLELQTSGPPVIVDGNDAAFAKHGYAREEMIGQPITLLDQSTTPELFEERTERMRQHGVAHFEVEHICKDRSTFIARVSAKMVEDSGSKSTKVLVVEQDITALKQAEERQKTLLEENRQLTHRLMQVQEDERRQLALSLHDNLGQLLTSINTDAFYIAKHASQADIRKTAEQISASTQLIFDANHEILLKLRPSELDALGLEAALEELTAFWRRRSGIECVLHADHGIDRLGEEHAIAIYRLVQEGLTNAIRHGRANHVKVRLHVWPDPSGPATIRLRITDDGQGMPEDISSPGLGIIGMRERVHALGGEFALRTLPHGGTHIAATIPLPEWEG